MIDIDRPLLAAAVAMGIVVLLVWPLEVVPMYGHADAVLHLTSGMAIALGIASLVPERDDAILVVTGLIGLVWEPIEAVWFGRRTLAGLYEWLVMEDTLFDVTLVFTGAFLALLAIRRYR